MSTSPLPEGAVAGVSAGNLYLSRETCDAVLPQARAVALLLREGRVLIVPLQPDSAGGLLLKVRNAHGDRVIHAQEFFRQNGYVEDFVERRCPLSWDSALSALVVEDLPRL
jgi:hypothetical protein